MMPDIKTLMLLYVIINVISAAAMAVIWSQSRGRFAGIAFWLVDMILQAAGSTLIVLRGLVPDIVSMVLANAMVQAGAIIIFIGLERFSGKKGRQIHNYILLAVFIAIFTYYSLVQTDLAAREIALSATALIITFQCCWLLLRRVDPGTRQVTRLTGIIFACYAAFSFARIILQVLFPGRTNDFFKAGAVDALAITVYIVLSVCLTISLVLMVNRRLLADVKAQEEKFTTAFHSSPYAITLTRPSDGTIFEVNDGFETIAGYQYAEVIGKTTLDLHLWVREEERLAVVSELAQGREVHAKEYQFRKKTGEVLTGLFSASLVTINNEKCILSSIGDITERKQLEQKLEEMATHDYLTGLPNRVLLTDRFTMAAALAHRNKARLAVMSLDLDDFKTINDTLGHGAGDQVLKSVSNRLGGIIRASDTLARVGGDEFILVMLETNHTQDATTIAQKILDSFTEPLSIDGHRLHLTTSIGIAIYPEDAKDLETLTKKSDAALYYAKGHGRNQFKFFGDGDVRLSGDHKSVK
jgi:diguanylate cyclase (GGDEF)-like protein/PAS domain S-box-containing protein